MLITERRNINIFKRREEEKKYNNMQLEIILVFKLTSHENKPKNSTQGGFRLGEEGSCLFSMNL